jgi:hypothetical protein
MSTINAAVDGIVLTADSSATLSLATSGVIRANIDGSGNLGLGGTANSAVRLDSVGTMPASSSAYNIAARGTVSASTTSGFSGFYCYPSTPASLSITNLFYFNADAASFGAGSTVTNQYGFAAQSNITGATNNYGFWSNIPSGSNRWNFYAAGTAVNYFAGDTRIGTTADLGQGARLNILSAEAEADLITLRYTNSAAGKHWRIAIDSASTFLLLNQAGTPVGVQLTDGGNSWSSYSDERQKTDLKLIEDAASKVGTLRAVTGRYTFDEETESRSFLIAQDVQKVLPEAVKQGADGSLLLAYQDVIPLLVAAIKEQQAMIDELKAKVAALETK